MMRAPQVDTIRAQVLVVMGAWRDTLRPTEQDRRIHAIPLVGDPVVEETAIGSTADLI